MFDKEYSWQQNELGEYSYVQVRHKKKMPAWAIALIVAVASSAVCLALYTEYVLPNMRPSTVISYSGPAAGSDTSPDTVPSAETSFAGLGERLDSAIVAIPPRSVGGGFFSQMMSYGGGSGVVVSADGYILTNNSVAEGQTAVTVRLSDGKEYEAQVVGNDSRTDCAVLKINKTDLTPVEFADSSAIQSGTRVAALGRILNEQLGTTLTLGNICGVSRSVTLQNGQSVNLFQTDAAASGSSGSVLIDGNGKVVGMVTTMISSGADGISLAIPSNDIMQVLESIINLGVAPSGLTIGIRGQDTEHGVAVEAVNEGSAAAKAGMKVGDLIMKADGTAVKSVSEINKLRDAHVAGDIMTFTVYREGETIELEVKLG